MPLRLGTRASALARWQAEWVAARLQNLGIAVELTPITTTGDRRTGAIESIGGQGVFTKEIQRALLDDRIDLAVHSLKDLPTAAVPGLCLAAVPERAAPGDVLVSNGCLWLAELPQGACVGTGSPRRRAQLLLARPDLRIEGVRGNIDTRLKKLRDGFFDAVILAEAGMRRLGFAESIVQTLPLEVMLPAVGQGALALETRSDDAATRRIVESLDHRPSHAAVLAERAMLSALEGGCLAPVAALAQVEGDRLTLIGRVLSLDGSEMLEARQSAPLTEAEVLGRTVAVSLLAQGAGRLIRAARQ